MTELTVSNKKNPHNPNSLTYKDRAKQIDKEKQKEIDRQKQAKKSPFKSFIQSNKDAYNLEDSLIAESATAYRIFKFLTQNMDGYNSLICSHQVLEEQFGISSSTVKRAIKLLKDKKFLQVYKSGTTNVYCINKNIVWNSWGTNFEYAKFSANIILSKTENTKKNKTPKIEIK